MKKDKSMDKIPERIDFFVNQFDKLREEGLEELKIYHLVKRENLKRGREHLLKKLGLEHPDIVKLDTKLRYNLGMEKDLNVLITEARTEVEPVDADTWKVHGKVVDQDDKGIKGLTIGLYDDKGKWQRDLGHGCSDDKGYFHISVKVKEKEEELLITPFYLYVLDQNKNILFKDTEQLFIVSGQIDYRAIRIVDEGEVCIPPEPEDEGIPLNENEWVVKGRITDEQGNGLEGMTVSLYDKDLLFDDRLGTTLTDEAGNFMAGYKSEEFRDLFEASPDIYLKVSDQEGNELYSSRKKVKCKAGRIESFNIKIKKTTRR